MEDLMEELIAEQKELKERKDKLMDFMCSAPYENITSVHAGLLSIQANIMSAYNNILRLRIASMQK